MDYVGFNAFGGNSDLIIYCQVSKADVNYRWDEYWYGDVENIIWE